MLNAPAVDSPSPVADSPRHRPRKPHCKRRRSAVDELRIALNFYRQEPAGLHRARPDTDAGRLYAVRAALSFCGGYVSREHPELSELLKEFADIGAYGAVGGAK